MQPEVILQPKVVLLPEVVSQPELVSRSEPELVSPPVPLSRQLSQPTANIRTRLRSQRSSSIPEQPNHVETEVLPQPVTATQSAATGSRTIAFDQCKLKTLVPGKTMRRNVPRWSSSKVLILSSWPQRDLASYLSRQLNAQRRPSLRRSMPPCLEQTRFPVPSVGRYYYPK